MILPNTRRFIPAFAAGLVAILLAAFLVPGQATADTRLVRSAHGITEYELSNGLRVLICPEPSKPTITVVMTYLVGSRLEGPGEKGMTHMLEHMLSKGTENFESIWMALAETGGTFNGTTWFDRTNFWVTLSASEENLDFALRIEADRMARAIIDSAELATEMGVISKELELIESEPRTILSHRMMGTAYLWHDYGHPTIGNRTDIVRYPIERLRAFYRRHYRPDNAVLFVGGDLDPERALALVERHFEPLTNPPSPIDVPSTEEPPQDGPRSVTVPWIGSIAAAGLMYHVPAASHEQAAAVTVLSEILTGPTGRLTRSLVDAGRASAIGDGDSDALLLAEPGVLEIVAEPLAGEDPLTLIEGMIDHVENFDPPTERETALAKARLLRAHREKNADAATLGVELSEWIAGGDWRLYFLHEERLGRVRPEDVAEAAKTYLRESNRTTGVLLPTESIDPVVVPICPDLASDLADHEGPETAATVPAYDRSPESIRERSIILRLDPGLEAMLLEERTRGERAYASIRVPYGSEESLTRRIVAARCLPEMLMQGTLDRNRQELQEAIDLLEAEIEVSGIEGLLTVSISADRDRLPDAIRLAGEILRRPVFDPERFEVVRRNKQAAVEGERYNPIERAMYELRRGLYPWPETSIHYMPTWEETLERWEKLELEGVRRLHGEQIGASHAKVAVVGDFVKADVLRALADAFEDWPSPAPYERIAMPFRPIREGEYLADTPGNPMAVIARATLIEMSDKDPDYAPLELAARAFCEGSRPRIAERLRHEEGLSYYASGSFHAERLDRSAYLYTFALTGPDQVEQAMESMDDEYRRWVEEGITEQELRKAKEGVLRGAERDFADNAYLARELTALMSTGQCVTSHSELRDRFLAASVEDVRRVLDTHFTRAGHFDIRAGDFGTIP